MSYFLLLIIMAALMLAGCFIGIKWRKAKDSKAVAEGASVQNETAES
ncbi:MAG: hypothetical protein IJ485_00365 [Lachnospiraceae bacterium]|nr:hypothetical protein [Lachnospiraceae bacterium]